MRRPLDFAELLKTAPTAPISINTAKPTAKNIGANVYKAPTNARSVDILNPFYIKRTFF
ncbi:MAG: hypothetical protein SPF98_05600 [Campylobacter sp.]|nr:hypothetical protein [Campylobacter sp.]